MFLYFLCYTSCALIIFKAYAISEAERTQRFIIEEDFKPPIFGSNKFNPVLQIFEDVNELSTSTVSNNQTSNVTKSVQITAIGEMGGDTTPAGGDAKKRALLFRQHVTFSTIKPTLWWTRSRKRTNDTQPNKKSPGVR